MITSVPRLPSLPSEYPADSSLHSEFFCTSPISIRRPVSTSGRVQMLPGTVLVRIVRGSVLPHPPDHSQPRPAQYADGVRVVAAAPTGPEIDVLGPRIVQAAGVGQGGHGVTQALVAGPSEGGHLASSRLLGHRGHAGVCRQRLGARIALASVADLAQERSGGEGRVGVAKEREEDLAVGMGSHSTGDARFKQPDLLDDRTQSGEQREHCSPARRLLCHLCPSPGGSSQFGEQFCGGLPSAVAMAGEEAGEALLAQSPGISGARVALEESQRDRRVEPTEDTGGTRPEGVEFGSEAIGQRDLGFHEVLAFSRVRALMAFVSSESGARTRKRWWSVRASSARQKASKESDLPPEARKRGRAAFSWLGWIGSTMSSASSR